ncbi:MAG: hypothetical protein H0X26_07545 [Alphaproteobacteria bacterium]|nr:hypothetical protein [Alphaproteobacteria bacterium]
MMPFYFLVFNPTICYSLTHSTVWNLSNDNTFFVGREDDLQKIESFFKGKSNMLALTGWHGFGKSQIAKKFAQQFHKNYAFIWWFDAQQDIPSQFERLTSALNTLLPEKEQIIPSTMSKEALVDTVKNILRIKNIRYLLIFDNADSYQKIEKYIPYMHRDQSGSHVLLTSRNPNIWTDTLDVGKLKREESLNLIKLLLPREKDEDAENLAETLSDYPLGLSLAIEFIKSCPTATIPKYLSLHMKRTLTTKEKEPNAVLDTYPNDAQTPLLIRLKSIEENHKDALQALFFMSLLNSKDIPESYIESWLKKTDSLLTADEAIKYIYGQSLVGVSETAEFHEKQSIEQGQITHYLSVHDLIHQLINETIYVEEKKKLLDTATEVMLEVFAGTAEVFIKKVIREPIHLLHAQKLCKNAKAISYSTLSLLKLKVCILECLMGPSRNFEVSKIYLEEIEEDLKNGLKLEPYYTALFKINKGFFECTHNAHYDKAIQYMTEGLNILTPFQDHNEEKLRAITNLAQYHAIRGETDIAEKFINEGKSIFSDSESIAYKSFFIYAWSLVLTDQGKFKESADVLNKAKEFPALYPAFEHGILHQTLETFTKQGNLTEASKTFKEFEKKLREFFKGRPNMGLGNVFYFKGLFLIYNKKNITEALNNLMKSLKVYQELFHGDKRHRVQARAHLGMGKAYRAKTDFKNALEEYLLSEEIYGLVLKEKKIDDVSDLYKELALLGIELKDEGLSQKYLKAHMDTFGRLHPRTQEILLSLDKNRLVAPL